VHPRAAVREVLALQSEGFGRRRIARRTGLPLSTVRDWLVGRVPTHSRGDAAAAGVCDRCGCDAHRFDQLPRAYVYLLGLYLGDGCISEHRRQVFRLRVVLDLKYPGIIHSAAAAMGEVRRGAVAIQNRTNQNCVEVASYWKQWPCYLPQHDSGKKHDRLISLTQWQRQLVDRWPDRLIRGLIHSDGCRFLNTGRGNWCWPRYEFSNRSADIRAIFCYGCDQLGVHWTRAGAYRIYVSRKADVAKLDTFIGPKR
jgi:hypothetical protein